MELLQLRYFLDSAHFGSIARAAEKHMVPASSVSASIRRLEAELGQKLFDRSSNRIILNGNGKRLCASLELIFSELDQTVNDIAYPTDDQVIRLLVLSHRIRVTEYMLEYQSKHPSVSFDTSINYGEDSYQDYDIIIGSEDPRFAEYSFYELSHCRVYLRVCESHPLYGQELTLRRLKDQSFVTMGGNMHQIIVEACLRAGFTPKVTARVNDITCYQKLLRSGMVIGHYRAPEHGTPTVPCLNVTDFSEYQSIRAYYREPATGNIKSFLEFLKTKTL